MMDDPVERLLVEAMKLPEDERCSLALLLLDSVGEETLGDVDRAWIDEAKRRLDDLRCGRVEAVRWEDARKRIFARD